MKNRRFSPIVIAFISLWTLSLIARTEAQEGKYDLKYNLRTGQEFSLLNMNIANNYIKSQDGFTKLSSRTRDLELNYKVISRNDTSMTFEVEYKKKLYKSTDKDGKLVVTDFAAILGKKGRYTISSTGDLSHFEGFGEIPSVTMPEGWKYTGAALQEEIEHLFLTLPEKPIAKGEKWIRKAFGVNIEYQLMDEVKLYGYDCVRIFAKIDNEQTISKRKDRNGNDITIENTEPYSDIYYFAYKEGMMLSRFSVMSLGQMIATNVKNEVVTHQRSDSLYETFVFLSK